MVDMNLSHEDAVMLWSDVVEMAHGYGDPSMLPWLERLTPVSLENSVMTVSTRQNWTVRKIMGEYRPAIEQLLREITLEPIALQVVVASAAAGGAPAVPAPAPVPAGASAAIPAIPPQPVDAVAAVMPAVHDPVAPVAAVPPAPTAPMGEATSLPTGTAPAGETPAPLPVAGSEMFHVKHPDDIPAAPSAAIETGATLAAAEQAATAGLSPAALAGAAVAAGRTGLFNRHASHVAPAAPQGVPVQPAPASGGTPTPTPLSVPAAIGGVPTVSPASAGVSLSADQAAAPGGVPAVAGTPGTPEAVPSAEPSTEFTALAEPETVAQDAAVPILEDGAVPKAAVSSGYSDFSFETYIVGESNTLAYSMARAVAEQPGSATNLNPLFIWGPSGNGKTHLLLSIANYLHEHQPGMNVQYVPSNAFVEQYVDEINNKKYRGNKVLEAYRTVDVLLVDDVQFFEAKQSSVTAFFDIFNQLIGEGKQIVLAADTPPDYLSLDDRMRTRFSSGVVIDIKAPTYEMKRAILLSYYERCRVRMNWCNVEIPHSLFDTIAQLAPNNPRNMQGLVTSIMIKASNDPNVLSTEGIKATIGEMFKGTNVVTIADIIRKICDAYDVKADDIKGKSRTKNISEARQVVMWMARQLTDESYENIGAELGGRDHSTVYYGISTIEKRSSEDKSFLFKLERLKKEILG